MRLPLARLDLEGPRVLVVVRLERLRVAEGLHDLGVDRKDVRRALVAQHLLDDVADGAQRLEVDQRPVRLVVVQLLGQLLDVDEAARNLQSIIM